MKIRLPWSSKQRVRKIHKGGHTTTTLVGCQSLLAKLRLAL